MALGSADWCHRHTQSGPSPRLRPLAGVKVSATAPPVAGHIGRRCSFERSVGSSMGGHRGASDRSETGIKKIGILANAQCHYSSRAGRLLGLALTICADTAPCHGSNSALVGEALASAALPRGSQARLSIGIVRACDVAGVDDELYNLPNRQ